MLDAGKVKRVARAGDVESLIELLINGKRRDRHAAAASWANSEIHVPSSP